MTSPIDIVAKAIRVADGKHTMGAGQLAEVAVKALDHDDIVANAVRFLRADQQENSYDSALGSFNGPDQFLAEVAHLVLLSVSEGVR